MSKVLILVHVEETFRKHFRRSMLRKITNAIGAGEFDEVIHFTSHVNDEQPVEELDGLIDEDVAWGWGYDPDCFETQPDELRHVIEGRGASGYTWVPPELRAWQHRLRNSQVTIGGGCDGECLGDMECILHHLKIPYERRPEFIY